MADQMIIDQPQIDTPAVAEAVAEAVDQPMTIDQPITVSPPEDSAVPGINSVGDERSRILKQVEFYFSDSNLPVDKFMWELTKKNENGWVSISAVSSFKRMRQFTSPSLIVEALRESPELLEVNDEGTMVRRKKPLVDKKDVVFRSIYAKGFPDETPELQDEIEQFFSQFGQVCAVRLRRKEDKTFKNSVFVEFSYIAEANKVAEMKLRFRDQDLLVMSKKAYIEMKAQEYADKPGADKRTGKKSFNAFKLNDQNNGREFLKRESAPIITKRELNKLDTLIKVSGFDVDISREEIKEAVGARWVKYNRGDPVAFAQLSDSVATETVEKLNAEETELGGAKVYFELPTEEEAAVFWKETEERLSQPRDNNSSNRGGFNNRGGRRGGNRPHRGGQNNNRRDGPPRVEKRKDNGDDQGQEHGKLERAKTENGARGEGEGEAHPTKKIKLDHVKTEHVKTEDVKTEHGAEGEGTGDIDTRPTKKIKLEHAAEAKA